MTVAACVAAGDAGCLVSAAVVDAGGHLVAFRRMDGAEFAGATIAVDKAYTAAGNRIATLDLREQVAPDGDLAGYYAASGGRFIALRRRRAAVVRRTRGRRGRGQRGERRAGPRVRLGRRRAVGRGRRCPRWLSPRQGRARPGPIGRVRFMDAQRVNLDGFAAENAALGMVAYDSPADPAPSLVLRDGRVVELDGDAPRPTSTASTSSSPGTGSTSPSPRRRWRSTTSPTRGCWSTRRCRVPSWCGWRPG